MRVKGNSLSKICWDTHKTKLIIWYDTIYNISHELYTRFCFAFFCYGYAISFSEFSWFIIGNLITPLGNFS